MRGPPWISGFDAMTIFMNVVFFPEHLYRSEKMLTQAKIMTQNVQIYLQSLYQS